MWMIITGKQLPGTDAIKLDTYATYKNEIIQYILCQMSNVEAIPFNIISGHEKI